MNIPSLINGSAGKPKLATAGKKCECRACGSEFVKGDRCAIIPNPRSMGSDKRFCRTCFALILAKTRRDVTVLDHLFD
jgi:hypothetical protein